MRFREIGIMLLLAVLPLAAQQSRGFKNLYSTAVYSTDGSGTDLTTGTLTATPSAAFKLPVAQFTCHVALVGGTSATGQMEGSNNGTDWFTLQSSVFSLTTNTSAGLVFQCPWMYVRFNCLTNVGGGTVKVFVAW